MNLVSRDNCIGSGHMIYRKCRHDHTHLIWLIEDSEWSLVLWFGCVLKIFHITSRLTSKYPYSHMTRCSYQIFSHVTCV